MIVTDSRNATLADLAEILKTQQDRKLDAVIPATAIRSRRGVLHVAGMSMEAMAGLDPNRPGQFVPTEIMDGHLADKLGIPVRYLRTLRAERPDLYDANVNGWLHGRSVHHVNGGQQVVEELAPADGRRFMFRSFTDPFGAGVGRALLSDRYAINDHLDVLTASMDGVRQSGADTEVVSCDLTETRMTVKITAPQVAVLAPALLGNYRSPFNGQTGTDLPLLFAGLVLTNSETGGGAFTIAPRITVQVCTNGMTMTKGSEAVRSIHLGGRLDEGVVDWSAETERLHLELVTAKTVDAVRAFLSPEFLARVVADMDAKAGRVLPGDGTKVVEVIAKHLRYPEATLAGILDHFAKSTVNPSAPRTAGDVMQAVTSWAQSTPADTAFDLEADAFRVLDLAAAAS